MTINRLIDIANLRQEIAIAAARMIAEEGTSYEVANTGKQPHYRRNPAGQYVDRKRSQTV